jgi:acyl-CoA dehydrogenase
MSYIERVVMAEEFIAAWPSLAVTVDSHNILVELIAKQGAPWMKDRYVERGMSGKSIMGDMMSEPGAGSDTRNFSTIARLEGNSYVVNGEKMWTTNGPWADVALLTAVSDPEAYRTDPRRGVIHLLVDRSVCNWTVRDLPFLGLRAGMTGHSYFKDTRVPKEYLFHSDDRGYSENLAVRGWARLLLAAWAVGLMRVALTDASAFAKERETFGKPIAKHQLVQDMIAAMVVDLETSRLVTYRAAEMMDRGLRADREQSIAKLYACEAAQRVTANAVQVLGARGLTTEEGYRAERYYRDARFLTVAEGTSQIMKLIIGRRELGVSAFS